MFANHQASPVHCAEATSAADVQVDAAAAQAIWPFPVPSTICTADATRRAAVLPGSPADLQLRIAALEERCRVLENRCRGLEDAQRPRLFGSMTYEICPGPVPRMGGEASRLGPHGVGEPVLTTEALAAVLHRSMGTHYRPVEDDPQDNRVE